MDTQDWTYDDLIALTLLYSAYADLKFGDNERAFILNKVGEVSFEKVHQKFLTAHDHEIVNAIESLSAKYCKDQASKQALMNDVRRLFSADHDPSKIEHYFEQVLSKII